jgi:hypothetical protein
MIKFQNNQISSTSLGSYYKNFIENLYSPKEHFVLYSLVAIKSNKQKRKETQVVVEINKNLVET